MRAARSHRPHDLAKRAPIVEDVLEHFLGDDHIEVRVGECQPLQILAAKPLVHGARAHARIAVTGQILWTLARHAIGCRTRRRGLVNVRVTPVRIQPLRAQASGRADVGVSRTARRNSDRETTRCLATNFVGDAQIGQ